MKKPSWKGKNMKIPRSKVTTVDRLKELREKEYEEAKRRKK